MPFLFDLHFLFAWMGSFVFWVVYVVMSFIIGNLGIREFAPLVWEFMNTGERPYKRNSRSKVDTVDIVFIMIGWYLLWWFVLPLVIFVKMIKSIWRIMVALFPVFRKIAVKSIEKIPEIEIKRKEEKG